MLLAAATTQSSFICNEAFLCAFLQAAIAINLLFSSYSKVAESLKRIWMRLQSGVYQHVVAVTESESYLELLPACAQVTRKLKRNKRWFEGYSSCVQLLCKCGGLLAIGFSIFLLLYFAYVNVNNGIRGWFWCFLFLQSPIVFYCLLEAIGVLWYRGRLKTRLKEFRGITDNLSQATLEEEIQSVVDELREAEK